MKERRGRGPKGGGLQGGGPKGGGLGEKEVEGWSWKKSGGFPGGCENFAHFFCLSRPSFFSPISEVFRGKCLHNTRIWISLNIL